MRICIYQENLLQSNRPKKSGFYCKYQWKCCFNRLWGGSIYIYTRYTHGMYIYI